MKVFEKGGRVRTLNSPGERWVIIGERGLVEGGAVQVSYGHGDTRVFSGTILKIFDSGRVLVRVELPNKSTRVGHYEPSSVTTRA